MVKAIALNDAAVSKKEAKAVKEAVHFMEVAANGTSLLRVDANIGGLMSTAELALDRVRNQIENLDNLFLSGIENVQRDPDAEKRVLQDNFAHYRPLSELNRATRRPIDTRQHVVPLQ